MEPPVRYLRSADGTRIAYASAGEGLVLVRLTAPGMDGIAEPVRIFAVT